MVGVNAYQSDEKITFERLKVDPAIEAAQCARTEEIRKPARCGKSEPTARSNWKLLPGAMLT